MAALLAVTLLPTFSVISSTEKSDIASGKELKYSGGSYILDLGRAYPVDDVKVSGVDTSTATVIMSNDPDFPKNSVSTAENIAIGKPIRSKLYGEGGYTTDYSAKNAVDGSTASTFISTPSKDTVEWLTIDLQNPAVIDRVSIDFSANRTYTVSVTNMPHGQTEEFTDGIELTEISGSKNFILPDEYKDDTFRYVRLRFAGDAPSDYYLDVNMYVNEFAVMGRSVSITGSSALTTTTFIKNDSVFTPNNAARGGYYRYLKVDGVSSQPTVEVNTQKELEDCIDVAEDAGLSMPAGATIYGSFTLDRVKDNNYTTYAAIRHADPYVQLDLKEKQAITHVEIYGRQDRAYNYNTKIMLSNSPEFDDYVILGKSFTGEAIGLKAAFVRSRNNIFDGYRYVRVYSEASQDFLVLSEIKVFAKVGFGDLYSVAENVWPTADMNEKVAYRATDKDVKSWWSGNALTINLDRCYRISALSVTASGNLKITYGCNNGRQTTYSDIFTNRETKNTILDGNINTIKIETADSNDISVYNIGVYSKRKNAHIKRIEPAKITSESDYDIIDLGRIVIIDHIEPCNLSAEVSKTEDFAVTNTIVGCESATIGARYIKVPLGEDINVIGYKSPELVDSKEGISVEFEDELYNSSKNATAFAAIYNNKRLETVAFGDASSGNLRLETGDKASFMVWDSLTTLKPLLPESETEYVNKIPQAEFYVDPDVEASGDGTKDSPFKTIEEAQEAVRAINSSMTGDIVVNLKGGRYYLEDTLKFNNSDSGTSGYKVIYKNADGETPVISGGRPITGFVEGENGIWYADASDFDAIYELMVNGKVATLARTETPIHADTFYSNGTEYDNDGISFNSSDLPMLSNPEEVFVHVARSWVDVLLKVTDISEDGEYVNLDMTQPRFDELTKDGALTGHPIIPSANFYIENALELLDNPGEFYFDKNTKVLYYMPRNGEDMNTAIVDGAVLEELITVKGTGRNNHVENLTFSGLRFENSTLDRMYDYGFVTAQAQVITFNKAEFLEGAIQVDYASNIEISGCEITGLTKPAISLHTGVLDSKISNNYIHDVGDGAIVLGSQFHHYTSEAYELTERVTVSDNIVNKTGLKHRGAPGIACYYVIDVDVVHNKITETSYSGISLGWGWSNYPNSTTCRNNRVAQNYIENTNLIATDGGGIYTLGNQPGTIIEENYIVQTEEPEQKTGINAIYPDEGSAYITIRNNVLDLAGVKDYADNVRDISLWNPSIKDIYVHNNYSTHINVRNDGTNCVVDYPQLYVKGAEPEEAKKIIASSAKEMEF